MRKVYFPNLNGLRFIAAFAVVFHHMEQVKSLFGFDSLWDNGIVKSVGKLGVILFFVLSGFLITYLLLEERRETGRIAIRNFYLRRILRIWPLYYLVVLLGLLLLPSMPFLQVPVLSGEVGVDLLPKLLLFLLFIPNLAFILYTPVPYASQAWSVGVEEQFYLLWPVILSRSKRIVPLLLGVIGVYLAVKIGLRLGRGLYPGRWLAVANDFWHSFSIDCMAIGGLAAAALFRRDPRVLTLLFTRRVQVAAYALTVGLILSGFKLPFLQYEMYALLFAVIILNLAGNERSLLSLENPLFDYLGKVSYGLYMYHPLALILCLKILVALSVFTPVRFFFFGTLGTVLLSALSYELLEKPLVRKKLAFSVLASGDNATAPSEPEPTEASNKAPERVA